VYEGRVGFFFGPVDFSNLSQNGSNPGLVLGLFVSILLCNDLTNAFISILLQNVPF
jgi:hypothetical protein